MHFNVDQIVKSKIYVQALQKTYHVSGKEHEVLKDVNFLINEGEFVCFLGPSGCGKSTILNIISELDTDYDGKIFINGILRDKDPYSEANSVICMSYLFQEPRLLPWLTVEKNIHFALGCRKFPKSSWNEITDKYLSLVKLDMFKKHYIHQLSGGMQHRVAIARAFATNPDILMMDEPFSALDELTAREIRKSLLELWRESKKTVLFITHNATEATFLADRVFLMNNSPSTVVEQVEISIERPRDYESDALFKENKRIVSKFMKIIA
jgi:NitT/TauT family transport system ATP-binding protein